MAVDTAPLLRKLEALAPHFGRAGGDLDAMVSRARAQDYRGVMQNARVVLETLLRSLVTEELGQTPGKAMLDELVAKFRNRSNANIVPTNILAHMGTVQAWGNLSMHDHAGSLDETAVHVGQNELVASLNSMVAILEWYADRKGLRPVDAPRVRAMAPGHVIAGRYRIDARLAEGGMGEVFRATHVELGRPLAIKVMRPELSRDPEFVERFRREAMTASRLGHPHIVDIIDSGSEDGQFYFVMEFLSGRTLTSRIADGPMPVADALELVSQVAQALDVAHRAGVVHRDLKPDNVIVLERHGRPFVKLVDFGVAKLVAPQDRQITSHGLIIGTPQYMSPEQASGLPVSAQSDIYSLGLILFELLTGERPLKGETTALVMAAHISQTAPELPAKVPPGLRTLVARMLAKKPEERPQSMAAVLTALAAVPTTQRNRWPLVAALAAVVLGGLVVLVVSRKEPPAPVPPPLPVAEPVRAPPPVVEPKVVAVEPPVVEPEVVDAGVPVKKVKKASSVKTSAPALMPADDL